jgi:phosphate transport system protein
MMREAYHEQLDLLIEDLARMVVLVEDSMARATAALLDADAEAAWRVVGGEAALAAICSDIDERALILAARQQPVAGDLRTIVAALRINADLERMGQLARHVADVAIRRHPRPAVPAQLRETVARMNKVAGRITAEVARALTMRDWRAAELLDRDDDAMDLLQQELYLRVLDASWPHDAEVTVDATLIGRFFERYADHAVSVAHRIAFLAGHEPLDRPVPSAAPK